VAAVDSVVLLPMLEIAHKNRWQTKWRQTLTVMASRTLKTPITRHAVAALQVEYFVFGKAILFTQHMVSNCDQNT
jgi:hypothetical protein